MHSPDHHPPNDEADAADLADVVLAVALTIRRRYSAALEPLGLSPWSSRALRAIGYAPAPLRLGDLAAHLRIAPRSATEVVDGLEKDGLINRRPDPADRRATLVELTDSGTEALARVAASQTSVDNGVFGQLDATERAALRDLLDRAIPAAERARRHLRRAAPPD